MIRLMVCIICAFLCSATVSERPVHSTVLLQSGIVQGRSSFEANITEAAVSSEGRRPDERDLAKANTPQQTLLSRGYSVFFRCLDVGPRFWRMRNRFIPAMPSLPTDIVPSLAVFRDPIDYNVTSEPVWRQKNSTLAPPPSEQLLARANDVQQWLALFCCTTAAVYLLIWVIWSRMQVETADDTCSRIGTCSCLFAIAFVTALSLLIFYLALFVIDFVNGEVERAPELVDPVTNEVLQERFAIHHRGFRAFEAGNSLVLSISFACISILWWRFDGEVPMSASDLGRFFLRGVTFSMAIALVAEAYMAVLLGRWSATSESDGFNLRTLLFMIVVGASEECAKGAAVILNIRLQEAARDEGDVPSTPWLPLAVTSPRSLALAGIAVGFGFMTCENVGYTVSTVTIPPIIPIDDKANDISEEDARLTLDLLSVVCLIFRVLFNLHPWLAGLSAARFARCLFERETQKTKNPLGSDISVSDFFWCIAPSAAVHALYDFAVVNASLVIFLLPPCFWMASRMLLINEWGQWKK